MGRTPRKPAFTDVVLPIFEQPVEEKKTRSKKQQAEDGKVSYERHRSSPRGKCAVCTEAHLKGEQPGIFDASYVRNSPDGSKYLCLRHTQEQRHMDTLAGLISGSAK